LDQWRSHVAQTLLSVLVRLGTIEKMIERRRPLAPAAFFVYLSASPHGRFLGALNSRCTNQSMLTILLLLALHAPEDSVLKARYNAVEGTNPEYGQGAIERNELLHHPLPHLEWLILTDITPAELQSKLNAAVDPKHGSFVVECASEEEEKAVRSGKIAMQR
jgi:hypothetical protein